MIHTDKHTKRFSHTTGPATCPLCGGSGRAPHILLRCNNHTLKRMHINRHHHAVSLCGEEISKGKLGSAIVTMDACNSEKLSDLYIEPPDDIERSIPDWVFPTQQNLPTRHQSRPDGVLVMPIEGWGRHLDPKQIPPPKGERHTSCRIQILLRHKPATDIWKSAQPASTPYSASYDPNTPEADYPHSPDWTLESRVCCAMIVRCDSAAEQKIWAHRRKFLAL